MPLEVKVFEAEAGVLGPRDDVVWIGHEPGRMDGDEGPGCGVCVSVGKHGVERGIVEEANRVVSNRGRWIGCGVGGSFEREDGGSRGANAGTMDAVVDGSNWGKISVAEVGVVAGFFGARDALVEPVKGAATASGGSRTTAGLGFAGLARLGGRGTALSGAGASGFA